MILIVFILFMFWIFLVALAISKIDEKLNSYIQKNHKIKTPVDSMLLNKDKDFWMYQVASPWSDSTILEKKEK